MRNKLKVKEKLMWQKIKCWAGAHNWIKAYSSRFIGSVYICRHCGRIKK